jgi:hypothetical protein
MPIYVKYPENTINKRIKHLNNRDMAILFGVLIGFIVGVYGIFFGHFTNVSVLGHVASHKSFWFRFLAVVLSGGTFGNLLSYVGSAVDIITNHKTIFDLIKFLKNNLKE